MMSFNQELLEQTRHQIHSSCLMCGPTSVAGFNINFQIAGQSTVEATVSGLTAFAGYPDTLHGGIIASLLDAAMTNCLFAHGIVAMTAHLAVRYRSPVSVKLPVHVQACLIESCSPLFILRAELKQKDQTKARADAKFMTVCQGENLHVHGCKPVETNSESQILRTAR